MTSEQTKAVEGLRAALKAGISYFQPPAVDYLDHAAYSARVEQERSLTAVAPAKLAHVLALVDELT